MARKQPKVLGPEGLNNPTLVALVTKLHSKGTKQLEVVQILASKGYTSSTGRPLNDTSVRRFEQLLGLSRQK